MQIILEINGGQVLKLNAHRVTNTGQVKLDPEAVSEYQIHEWSTWKQLGTVEHRYGDGAAALARKALELIGEVR